MGSTGKLILGVVLVFGTVGHVQATVSIFTPALRANGTAGQLACRVTNTDTSGQFVTLNVRNGFSGSVVATDDFALGAGETAELLRSTGGYAYCEAIANTATIADKLLLSVNVRDGSDTPTGSLPGIRVVTGSGTVVRTPSMETTSGETSCHIVNVGASSRTVTWTLLDDAGDTVGSLNISIGSMQGVRAEAGDFGPMRCEVAAASNGEAKDLRVSMFEDSEDTSVSSKSPLAGALRP